MSTTPSVPLLPGSLRFRRDGDVGILTLARPDKRNALDDATVAGIEAFFTASPTACGPSCSPARASISRPGSI